MTAICARGQAVRLGSSCIPHIAAGSQHVNRVTYTPQSCGARTIYVTAQLASGAVSNSIQIANTPCAMILPIIGGKMVRRA